MPDVYYPSTIQSCEECRPRGWWQVCDNYVRAMAKISENVARENHFYHSLYYTGPALFECAERTDSIKLRWRVQHRDALSAVSRRVADAETDEEVLLHFKPPRASKHYSQMSRANDIYGSGGGRRGKY